jgi:dihydroflavonol-4-reductase
VRDAASGVLLADERGEVGERYILGGRNFTFDRLFADLGRISGVPPPVKVPRLLATGAAMALGVGPGRSPLKPSEVVAASHWWTYTSAKAIRELGFKPRPHEETLEATVEWFLDREGDRIVRARRSQELQYRVAGAWLGAAESVAGTAARAFRRPGR